MKIRGEQIKNNQISGKHIVKEVGIYNPTQSYSAGDIVYYSGWLWEVKENITIPAGTDENDFSNAPNDLSTSWRRVAKIRNNDSSGIIEVDDFGNLNLISNKAIRFDCDGREFYNAGVFVGSVYNDYKYFTITNYYLKLYERKPPYTSVSYIYEKNNALRFAPHNGTMRIERFNNNKYGISFIVGVGSSLIRLDERRFGGNLGILHVGEITLPIMDGGNGHGLNIEINGQPLGGNVAGAGDVIINGGDASNSFSPNNHGMVLLGAKHTKGVGIFVPDWTNIKDSVDIRKTVVTEGRRVDLKTVTSDYTLTKSDHYIKVDATQGNVDIWMPDTSTGNWHGQIYKVKRIDTSANTVTIKSGDTTLAQIIATLSQGQKVTIIYDSQSNQWEIW